MSYEIHHISRSDLITLLNTRLLLYIFVFLFGLGSYPLSLQAQSNPYKIDDEVYSMFRRISINLKKPEVLASIDTMILLAKEKKDIKGQCIAIGLKADHYYYCNDIENLKKAVAQTRTFAEKTEFQQYVFSPWNRLIGYYLGKMKFKECSDEIQLYQAEALRLKNDYGIAYSYRHLARLYLAMDLSQEAIVQLLNGAKFLENAGKTQELDQFYTPLASEYSKNGDIDKAIYYFEKAKKYCIEPNRLTTIYINQLRMQCKKKDRAEADLIYRTLQEHIALHPVITSMKSPYYNSLVIYNLLKEDYTKALAYNDSINTLIYRYTNFKDIYYRTGNYKLAYENLLELYQIVDSTRNAENTRIVSMNVEMFNNHRLELELEKEKTQSMAIVNQNRTILVYLLSFFLIVMLLGIIFYIRKRAANLHRLQQEKSEAEKMRALALSQKEIAEKALYETEIAKADAEKARDKAQKADQLKSIFLQNMSHEIRTPLNAIVGFSNLLGGEMAESFSEEEKTEFISLINSNTELLLQLVNDILDISKLESGTYKIDFNNTDILKVLHSTSESIRSKLPEGVELCLQIDENISPAEELIVKTDGLRVQQLLINLLTNACKNTKKGSITLGCNVIERDASFWLQLSVTDTGCGIPPENAEIIFERFKKLDDFKQGTGLGLNICHHIALLLGGRIYLDTTYSQGARFILEIPR